jgi:hypothetical protein
VHKQVYVVFLAVELLQLSLEVRTDFPHDLFAPRMHGVGHGLAAVLRDENQMDVQVVEDVAAGAYIGIRVPGR